MSRGNQAVCVREDNLSAEGGWPFKKKGVQSLKLLTFVGKSLQK